MLALLARVLWRTVLAAAFTFGLMATTDPAIDAAERPIAPQSPEALIERHDCWTGPAPSDEIPGHVVTDEGYGGRRAVDRALGQIFEGEEHGLRVYAFCP